MPKGIIVKGIGGFYYVADVEDNEQIYECKIRGRFKKLGLTPMIGDNVIFELLGERVGIINEICQRKNIMIRPPVTNIDQVILVISIIHPEPNLLFLDRLLVFLDSKNIDVIICINKIDLDLQKMFFEISKVYDRAGYRVINISAKQHVGLETICDLIKGKVTTLAGASGVGKTTLINSILGLSEKTGELSKKTERGKHTTRHVELFMTNRGFILDTPGFSLFDISEINKDDLKYQYREFNDFEGKCKFNGCNHINEPGCAVKQSVGDGIIDVGRYERYKQIFNELNQLLKNKSWK